MVASLNYKRVVLRRLKSLSKFLCAAQLRREGGIDVLIAGFELLVVYSSPLQALRLGLFLYWQQPI